MQPNELRHWGIKGMHWGVRRSSGATGGQSQTNHPKSSSNSNRNQKYKNIAQKANRTKMNSIKKGYKPTMKQTVVGGLVLGALGYSINRFLGPSIDIAGKAMASKISDKLAARAANAAQDAIFREVAKKGFDMSPMIPL